MNAFALRLLSTVAFVGTLAMNALANILPLNGMNTGQVSARYPSLFTPAGLTFSIWSIIYLLLTGFVVLTWLRHSDRSIARILPWFIASCVLNMSWIWVWHHLMAGLSVVVMLALLAVQTILFSIIHRQYRPSRIEQIFVALPFTIYLAWISVATIANISAWLIALGWTGGVITPQTWTVIMMTIAALLAAKITIDFRTPFFAAVIVWALLGIFIRWTGTDYRFIVASAVVLMIALLGVIIYTSRRHARA